METILRVHLVGHNDSSLVIPLPTSSYLIEKRCVFWRGKKLAYLFLQLFQEHPEYTEAIF